MRNRVNSAVYGDPPAGYIDAFIGDSTHLTIREEDAHWWYQNAERIKRLREQRVAAPEPPVIEDSEDDDDLDVIQQTHPAPSSPWAVRPFEPTGADDEVHLVDLCSAQTLAAATDALWSAEDRARRFGGPREPSKQIAQQVRRLLTAGHQVRAIFKGGRRKVIKQLLAARETMPTVAHALTQIATDLAIAGPDAIPRIEPILLAGPPGTGKTHLVRQLAQLLSVPLFQFSMESAQTPAELEGSARHWYSAQPGPLFDLMIQQRVANPIVLLDEVDKARRGNEHDVLGALYRLLEPNQVRCWTDRWWPELPLNLGYVTFIATANDLSRIPAPILNRFRVILVAPPDRMAVRALVQTLFKDEIEHAGLTRVFKPRLPAPILAGLSLLGLRDARRVLKTLMGQARLAGRKRITEEDVTAAGIDWVELHLQTHGMREPNDGTTRRLH